MKHVSEEQLALYAWGDLAAQDGRAIGDHLQTCDYCQSLFSELQNTRTFIATSLENPANDELSEVRTRLTANLHHPRNNAKPWVWWGVGVAAALTLLALPFRSTQHSHHTEMIEPLILTAKMNPGPALQIPLTSVAISRPRHLHPLKAGIRSVTLISQAGREPIVKMTTADPDVVILWQLNEKPGKNNEVDIN